MLLRRYGTQISSDTSPPHCLVAPPSKQGVVRTSRECGTRQKKIPCTSHPSPGKQRPPRRPMPVGPPSPTRRDTRTSSHTSAGRATSGGRRRRRGACREHAAGSFSLRWLSVAVDETPFFLTCHRGPPFPPASVFRGPPSAPSTPSSPVLPGRSQSSRRTQSSRPSARRPPPRSSRGPAPPAGRRSAASTLSATGASRPTRSAGGSRPCAGALSCGGCGPPPPSTSPSGRRMHTGPAGNLPPRCEGAAMSGPPRRRHPLPCRPAGACPWSCTGLAGDLPLWSGRTFLCWQCSPCGGVRDGHGECPAGVPRPRISERVPRPTSPPRGSSPPGRFLPRPPRPTGCRRRPPAPDTRRRSGRGRP
mmetsp:Transcript_36088/g.71018  ORF Transcript_36088/g.71018 Transcript_36088/m.71018 type:complete len:361 (+) Transcript_36088:89-1171(+)